MRSPRWQGNSRAQAAASLALKLKALLSVLASHSGGEACVCDLSAGIELSQPTISHHLEVLRTAGLLESERRGSWVYYRVVAEALQQLSHLHGADAPRSRGSPVIAVPHHQTHAHNVERSSP